MSVKVEREKVPEKSTAVHQKKTVRSAKKTFKTTNNSNPIKQPNPLKIGQKSRTTTTNTKKAATLSKPNWANKEKTSQSTKSSKQVPTFMKETAASRRRTLDGQDKRGKLTGDPTHYAKIDKKVDHHFLKS